MRKNRSSQSVVQSHFVCSFGIFEEVAKFGSMEEFGEVIEVVFGSACECFVEWYGRI